jgi:multidrug resistance efflux pump
MADLHIPEYGGHECVPTRDAYDSTVRALEKHRQRADHAEAELASLRANAEAVAEEYDREPRLIASGAVAGMLREWVNG